MNLLSRLIKNFNETVTLLMLIENAKNCLSQGYKTNTQCRTRAVFQLLAI